MDGIPLGPRAQIVARALLKAASERRTKRALFFVLASFLIGFTVGEFVGLAVCGSFGASLYLVVLVLRMQRHLREGSTRYHASLEQRRG